MDNQLKKYTNTIINDCLKDGDVFLVTGADGFIGRNIVKFLKKFFIANGFTSSKITAVVHNLDKARQTLGESKYLELIFQDITKEFSLENKADYIIHAAGICDTKRCQEDPMQVMEVNVNGTKNLLEFAARTNAKGVLLISSASVYGKSLNAVLSESDIGFIDYGNINNVYAISKLNTEFFGALYLKEYQLPIKIVRPFHLYGSEMHPDNTVAEFISCANNNRDIIIHSNGQQLRNFTYIYDAVEAMVHVMFHGEIGQVYNIGSKSSTISILDLAKKIQHAAKGKTFDIIVESSGLTVPSNYLDMVPSTLKIEQLGWSQRVDLDEGISLFFSSN